MAGYPLLLPILFTAYQRRLLHEEGKRIWERLLEVETMSGQTGVPVMHAKLLHALPTSRNFDRMTKGVLEVVQLAAAWVNYTEVLLSAIEAIQESMRHINTTTPHARLDYVEKAESVMVEYLEFISQRCKVMLSELQYYYKRGQAQMTALYNYIAKSDAQSTLDISTSSRQIAAASRRDSSAMKGIALLTMFFLPGTYAATFLAMPLFDFSNPSGAPTVKSGFWIYWAITIPLTTIVLVAYLTYLVRIQRRDRLEDHKIVRRLNEDEKGRSTHAVHSADAIRMRSRGKGAVQQLDDAVGRRSRRHWKPRSLTQISIDGRGVRETRFT
ncbi:hypothetical protein HO133_007289 [Letharia lupina]|uniref:Uncharacterized protein n=1 Tax=Letharia lupina TaxID=560253 RepID=A0A8H6FIL6_9LECA|nr:uncharacterized protein HO133_007289 [Letharia lupina]KAF6229173.1 hypothetical protein HO133_007289 [Letharia lupina]